MVKTCLINPSQKCVMDTRFVMFSVAVSDGEVLLSYSSGVLIVEYLDLKCVNDGLSEVDHDLSGQILIFAIVVVV